MARRGRYSDLPQKSTARCRPVHRLELKRWLQAEWRPSDTGREAKFYALTKAGKKQLALEKQSWKRLAGAVCLIFEGGE